MIRGLGVDAWLAVRLWRALLLGVAGWGAARLLGTVHPGAGAAGRVAAATVYVANPYVVVAGATSPVLQPYALLPWLVVALAQLVLFSGMATADRAMAKLLLAAVAAEAALVALFLHGSVAEIVAAALAVLAALLAAGFALALRRPTGSPARPAGGAPAPGRAPR